jgi:hypothetical protein
MMIRYESEGTSRTTGIQYTTTVIEALGVEHKETTRYVPGRLCNGPSSTMPSSDSLFD